MHGLDLCFCTFPNNPRLSHYPSLLCVPWGAMLVEHIPGLAPRFTADGFAGSLMLFASFTECAGPEYIAMVHLIAMP